MHLHIYISIDIYLSNIMSDDEDKTRSHKDRIQGSMHRHVQRNPLRNCCYSDSLHEST